MRRIGVRNLRSGMQLAQPVISSDGKILLTKGQLLRDKYIDRLRQLGVQSVYVVDPRFPDLEVDGIISEQTRLQALRTLRAATTSLISGNSADIPAIKDIVEMMISDLSANPRLMINVLDIRTHDDYTFAHSVNVCSFAILVGLSQGLNSLALRELGIGALMHDLGKTLIPKDVLNKPGKLTDDEYDQVKLHAFDGFNILRHQEISLLSSHIALQHHERVDGSGYPRGLAGEGIHPYARIVAVADVYDALASDRVYRPRFLPHDAAAWLTTNSGTLFDADVIRCFLQRVAFYPIGTLVKLSTGVTGVVVDINQPMTIRPIVRLLQDGAGHPLQQGEEVDLVKHPDISIIAVLSDEADPF